MSSVTENLETLARQLPPDGSVRLVGVSKYATLPQMIEAYEAGLRDFGENKLQDFEAKIKVLPEVMRENCRWHFLGHIQRNKAKKIAGCRFDLLHSLDSLELAGFISQAVVTQSAGPQKVLLQLNLTREPQKTGFFEEKLLEDFPRLIDLHGIEVVGLMTIGHHTEDANESKRCFEHLHGLRDHLVETTGHTLPELSMGMSQDFNYAIECGATIIRIGNRIFGS